MVDREVIGNIIDKSILTVKCGVDRIGNNHLNNRIKGAMNRFAEDSKNYPIEHAIVIINDGSVVKEMTGDEHHVQMRFSDYVESLDYQMGDLTMVHNHVTPFGEAEGDELQLSTIFSESDILNLWEVDTIGFDEDMEDIVGTGVKSVACQCSNGSRMVLTRKDGNSIDNIIVKEYIDNNGDLNKSELYKDFLKTYNDMEDSYREYIGRFI